MIAASVLALSAVINFNPSNGKLFDGMASARSSPSPTVLRVQTSRQQVYRSIINLNNGVKSLQKYGG
jgi:hypothetical protein